MSVGDEHAERAEDEQRERVLDPGLLLRRVDAAEPEGEPLERAEEARQRLSVALEDAEQVDAERLGEQRGSASAKTRICIQPIDRHRRSSEPLGAQERVDQVGGDQDREDAPSQ